MKRVFSVFLIIACFNAFIPATAKASSAGYIEGEAIVLLAAPQNAATLKSGALQNTLSTQAQSVAQQIGGTVLRTHSSIAAATGKNIVHVHSSGMTTEELIASLAVNPAVLGVMPNYTLRRRAMPNDPSFGLLWGMERIGAPSAWDTSKGSRSVIVAVMDSGIDYLHEDIAANMGKDLSGKFGKDAVNGTDDPMDHHGHGTHVAGTIGAVGNNRTGVAGVCWEVSLLAVNVIDEDMESAVSAFIAGAEYILDQKNRGLNIRVVNMSIGEWFPRISDPATNPFAVALKALADADILLVTAAGNESQNSSDPGGPGSNPADPEQDYRGKQHYPGDLSVFIDNMINVAAIDRENNLAVFSNYSPVFVHLAAPGVDILSTVPADVFEAGYLELHGTSMAAPHVAGAAALLAARRPHETAAQIKARILQNTSPAADLAGKVATGGYLNVGAAMTAPEGIRVTGVTVSPTSFTLNSGNETILAATVSPSNASNRTVVWSSSDSRVASVSQTGRVRAHAAGTATIAARTLDGGFRAGALATVKAETKSDGCNGGFAPLTILLALPLLVMRR